MARAPEWHSFNPIPTENISNNSINPLMPMHLKINQLTFCNPGYVKCYFIYPFMARVPYDQSLTLYPPRMH